MLQRLHRADALPEDRRHLLERQVGGHAERDDGALVGRQRREQLVGPLRADVRQRLVLDVAGGARLDVDAE